MSDILIRGMDMPTSCRECRLKMNCDDCEGWECVCVPLHQQIGYLGDLLADKRRDDCPLVPVPPHGRLGDFDVLYEVVKKRTRNWNGGWSDIECVLTGNDIKNAPTVIEAEED